MISDELLGAYLNCKTKARLTFDQAGMADLSHPISHWQRHVAEVYQAECCDHCRSASCGDFFVGCPPSDDLKSAKYQLVIQPYVTAHDVGSHIHALERAPKPILKQHNSYIPVRFVPSEKITRHHKLMLAFDAFVLWKASGRTPTKGTIIHGLKHTVLSVKLDTLIHEVESIIEKLRVLITEGNPPDPVLIKHCSECGFMGICRKRVIEKDDLSLLDGLGATDRTKLNAKGIFTVTQLAYTFRPRRRPKDQASRREKYHHALKALAIRDRKIHVVGRPELTLSGTPVYLDVESLPDRGFYYLIGLRIPQGSSFLQYSFWADQPSNEEHIWQSFLDVLRGIDDPVIIHYGAYETHFLKRLEGRYPASSVDKAYVDGLIKRAVNLLTITYSQIYFPTYSNGLKEVSRHLGFQWSHPAASGLQSVIWRQQWEETADSEIKQTIITYNKEDCEALELVTHAIERVALFAERRDQPSASADEVCVHSEDVQNVAKWRKFTSSVPDLEAINKAAHWDYQRDRVYVRNRNVPVKSSSAHTLSKTSRPHINKEVVCSTPTRCPTCGGKSLKAGPEQSKIIYDLCLGKTSVKRWIVKYLFHCFECLKCRAHVYPMERTWGRGKYGWNLVAFLIYEIVELSVAQLVATRHANRLFSLTLPRSSVAEQKKMAAKFYEETRQMLLRRIVEGVLVHVDETPIVTYIPQFAG